MRIVSALRRRWHVLVSMLVIVSLGAYTSVASASTNPAFSSPRYTAVQLINGILFADGPAAPKLKAIHPRGIKHNADLREFENRVDKAVAADPAFATRFAIEAQSGDNGRVQSALRSLGGKVTPILAGQIGQKKARELKSQAQEALRKQVPSGSSDDQLQQDVYQVQISLNLQIQTNTQAQAEVELELALALALLVVLAEVVPAASTQMSNSSRLASEMFVDNVTRHLRAV